MHTRARAVVVLIVSSVLSCEPAPIATPPAEDAPEGWEPSADWPLLPSDRPLGRVLGVALDDRGRVWISHTGADGGHPEILALDPESGAVVDAIDASAFESPHALAWDDAGQLWVTDDAAHHVVVLDGAGHVRATIGGD